jgi:Flp pilus assembly protein CpaB
MAGNFNLIRRNRSSALKIWMVSCISIFFVCMAMLILLFNVGDFSEANVTAAKVVVETQPELEMKSVLVPIQTINMGAALEPTLFRLEQRPKIAVPGQVVSEMEFIQGKYAKSLIIANQPLYQDYITNQRPVNAITAMIPEGYRAVTIQVDVRTGIEGWARPGARVDLVWNTTIRGKQGVAVIVENIKVLSASRSTESSQNVSADAPIPTELTLLASIQDANKIILAQRSGTISLSLRGDSEPGKTEAGGAITVDDLLGTGKATAPRQVTQNVIKIKDNNGEYEEFVMQNGRLIPLSLLSASNLAAE